MIRTAELLRLLLSSLSKQFIIPDYLYYQDNDHLYFNLLSLCTKRYDTIGLERRKIGECGQGQHMISFYVKDRI